MNGPDLSVLGGTRLLDSQGVWMDAGHPHVLTRPVKVSSGKISAKTGTCAQALPSLALGDEGPFTGTFHHHHPRVSRRKVLGETAFNSLCSKARRSTITTAPPSHVRVSVDCNGAVGLFFMRITYKHLVL